MRQTDAEPQRLDGSLPQIIDAVSADSLEGNGNELGTEVSCLAEFRLALPGADRNFLKKRCVDDESDRQLRCLNLGIASAHELLPVKDSDEYRALATPGFKKPTEEEIDSAIRQLNDDDFETREKATKDLTSKGLDALPLLLHVIDRSPSQEVTRRAELMRDNLISHLVDKLPPDSGLLAKVQQGQDIDLPAFAQAAAMFGKRGSQLDHVCDSILSQPAFAESEAAKALREKLKQESTVQKEWLDNTVAVGSILQGRNKTTDADLACLKFCAHTESMGVLGRKVTDAGVEKMKDLVNLERLSLEGTGVTDNGLKHISGLTKLQSLRLGHTQVSDAGLKELAKLKNLEDLGLWHTNVTDAGLDKLAALTSLTDLDLSECKITDAGVKKLAALKGLEYLNLSGTAVSEAGLRELKKALPNCQIVDKFDE